MQAENFVDPIDFIIRLNQGGVKYLLIGRQALVIYGAPLQSFDYDFYIDPSRETLKKIWKIAKDLRMAIEPPPPKASRKLSLYADNLKVDIFRAKKYPIRSGDFLFFNEMFKNKKIVRDKDKFFVCLSSLEDLKKTKQTRLTAKIGKI